MKTMLASIIMWSNDFNTTTSNTLSTMQRYTHTDESSCLSRNKNKGNEQF